MTTVTIQIPNNQVGWFEQMIQTMGWKFTKDKPAQNTIDSRIDELLAMFKTDNISQEDIDKECEIVREKLFDERQIH